jgi:hypothetical protein
MFFDKVPDFSQIQFSSPKKSSDGKYFVSMNVKGENDVPELILCQLVPRFECSNISDTALGVVMPTSCSQTQFVREIDDYVLASCKERKKEWFNSDEISDAYLEQAFMPSLKPVKKSSDFTMTFRTMKDMEVYDKSRNQLDMTHVTKGCNIAVIYQIEGVWFTKTRFGITYKARQLMLHQNAPLQKFGKCLFEDAEEDLDNVFPDE